MCRYAITRREFVKKSSVIGSTVLAAGLSLEEKSLLAAQKELPLQPSHSIKTLPTGKIGDVTISRLICGGNLVGGYAHSRDLVYVSELLKAYFTEEKIFETLELCEESGINTIVLYAGATRHANTFQILNKYRNQRGGKIQFLAQVKPDENDLTTNVKQAIDHGAVGAFVLGNIADDWVRNGKVDLLGKVLSFIKQNGLIAGVAGHNINVPVQCENAGIGTDFYMKTLHSTQYWSTRRANQHKDVIDNYRVDNYWDKDPEKTIEYMKTVKKPWIGYKVLAAGAIEPQDGFEYGFHQGADFLCVGMYDFQVRENALIAKKILSEKRPRQRPWMA